MLPRLRAAARGSRSAPWTVAAAALVAGALHLRFLGGDLWPDEGGYLQVARHWHTTGPFLYGSLWVDRPPGLLVLFGAADALGPRGVRVMAGLAAVVLVLAAGWAGWAAAGPRAARWSAVVAAALGGSALLGAQELDGELLAAPLVMLSAASLLQAARPGSRPPARAVLAVAAGGTGLYAVLVKQNVVDGLVFATTLLLMLTVRRRLSRHYLVELAAPLALGAAVVVGALVFWALQHGRLTDLWYAMYGFRLDALTVIDSGPLSAPELRLLQLGGLALAGGLVYLGIGMTVGLRRDLAHGQPLQVAIMVTLGVEVVGVALGASYWPHYLIQLVPMLALGCGVVCSQPTSTGTWLRRLCILAAASTLIATPAVAALELAHGNDATRVGHWVRASARADDSLVVTYSHPNVVEASGLTTPYPYAWSLPVRTLDPHLTRLSNLLNARRAPTWIVEWDAFDAWELDPDARMATLVSRHYHVIAHVCGHAVWLRNHTDRAATPPPARCGAAFGEG